MADTITVDYGKRYAVFPLQDCPLFPNTVLPLHVFEPRYRQLVNEALDSLGLIAMGTFAYALDREEYLHGRPALRPVACFGYIRQYEELSDGRYVMLLQGVCRAELTEEVDHTPYRMFRLRPYPETEADATVLEQQRRRLDSLLADTSLRRVQAVHQLADSLKEDISTPRLTDILVSALCRRGERRYMLLEERDPSQRANWVIKHLEAIRRKLVS